MDEATRKQLEQLNRATRTEFRALHREFEAKLRALTSGLSGRPDELQRRLGEAFAEFDRLVQAKQDETQKAMEERFGPPLSPPRRLRAYVERFPPRTPKPRDDKRPSAGGVLVQPNKPNNLSGGAAAPLEFD